MTKIPSRPRRRLAALSATFVALAAFGESRSPQLGSEVAIPVHLQDGEEFTTPIEQLIRYGARLFSAKFTVQEGAGRPQSKGTGAPISDPSSPLVFPRNFDRLSSPDANSCSGCHNAPLAGAGGDQHAGAVARARATSWLWSSGAHAEGAATAEPAGTAAASRRAANNRMSAGISTRLNARLSTTPPMLTAASPR